MRGRMMMLLLLLVQIQQPAKWIVLQEEMGRSTLKEQQKTRRGKPYCAENCGKDTVFGRSQVPQGKVEGI